MPRFFVSRSSALPRLPSFSFQNVRRAELAARFDQVSGEAGYGRDKPPFQLLRPGIFVREGDLPANLFQFALSNQTAFSQWLPTSHAPGRPEPSSSSPSCDSRGDATFSRVPPTSVCASEECRRRRSAEEIDARTFVVMVAGLAGLHSSKRQPLSGVRKLRENSRYLLVGLVRHHAMVEVRTSQGGAEGLRSPSVSVAGPSGCASESKGSGRIPRPQSQKGRSRAQPAELSVPLHSLTLRLHSRAAAWCRRGFGWTGPSTYAERKEIPSGWDGFACWFETPNISGCRKPLGQAKWGFGEQAVATIPQSLRHVSSMQLRIGGRLVR